MNIIQIGCNDGNDHVFKFVNENHLKINKVLLIDAVPACIEMAKEQYKNFAFIEYKNLAIIADLKEMIPFFVSEHDHYAQCSLYKNHVIKHCGNNISEIIVPAKNINDLIFKFSENIIDRLYIDAEGEDANLILNLNFNIKQIKFIQYESAHSSNNELAMEKLQKNNYNIEFYPSSNITAIKKELKREDFI